MYLLAMLFGHSRHAHYLYLCIYIYIYVCVCVFGTYFGDIIISLGLYLVILYLCIYTTCLGGQVVGKSGQVS